MYPIHMQPVFIGISLISVAIIGAFLLYFGLLNLLTKGRGRGFIRSFVGMSLILMSTTSLLILAIAW